MSLVFWRSFFAHKLRVALTGIAIALGVALMAGTYVLTDTLNASYTQLVNAAFSGEAVVIWPAEPLGENNVAQISPITDAMLAKVRRVPGVANASGEMLSHVTLFDVKGKALGLSGASFVTSVVAAPFEPLEMAEGHMPTSPGEMAVDEATLTTNHLRTGDILRVAGAGQARDYRIVGAVRFAGSNSFAGASVAVLTLPQAQAVAGEVGHFDEIDVAAAKGLAPAQLRARLAAALPRDVTARTGPEEVAQLARNFASDIAFFRDFLLVFAYVSLFVGGFIILNTFSVTVAQRTREIGLLRAMGASRRQVLWSIVGESAVLGSVGSIAGVALGLLLAPGLAAVFETFGAQLPDEGTVLEGRTVIVSLAVGLVVSVVAGLAPALRATRVPPMAALREGVGPEPGRLGRHSVLIGAVVCGLGAAMVLGGVVGNVGGVLAGIGALLVFVGIALLSPKVVPSLARALGALVTWRGVTGVIARENSRRQPGRTAVTSAALMVGLALVTFVSVLSAGAKATIDSAVDASFAGNLIVEGVPADDNGIPASLAVALHKVQGVAVVAPVRFAAGQVKGVSAVQPISGVNPVAFYRLRPLTFEKGTVAAWDDLGNGQTVLTKSFARSGRFHLGSTLSMLTASGRTLRLRVVAIVSAHAQLLGPITVTRHLLQHDFAQSNDAVDFVGFAKGASDARAQQTVNRLLAKEFPQARSLNEAKFRQQQANEVNPLLGLVYVLLALAVVVSLFGLLNTLALAVHERKRELGLLRAVGASRSQVRQIVRYESVITSLIGAVIGLAVGLLFAVTLSRPIVGPGFVLAIPVVPLVAVLFLAGIAGVFAAAFPARRAARLDVLIAIAME